jgi:outer membrane protein assembly factor BamB
MPFSVPHDTFREVVSSPLVYVGSSDYHKLLAIKAADGKKVWDFDTAGSSWSTPAVTDKLVYAGAVGSKPDYMTHYGAYFAVDRSTGKLVCRTRPAPAEIDLQKRRA